MKVCRFLIFGWIYLLLAATAVHASGEASRLQAAVDHYHDGNLQEAEPVFKRLAMQGNPEAHYYLGLIYTSKGSVYYAAEKGISHTMSAIEQGHAQAMFHMGLMHDSGIGVQRNSLVANDWYRKSRASRKPDNANVTFYKHRNDKLEKVDYSVIFQELLSQAEAGDAEIQFQVARIMEDGKFVPRDFDKALFWYRQAAENAYHEAQFILGYFYCRGIGVKKDVAVANEWLIRSRVQDRCTE